MVIFNKNKILGFTLIEILVVLAIIATLLSLVTPRYFNSIDRSKETILKHDLAAMREAIDKFYSDRNAYPETLNDLVQFKYLRAIPKDPITESDQTWQVIAPEQIDIKGSVYDVKSGAQIISSEGTPFAEW
jgi:general secretion pathway protein G